MPDEAITLFVAGDVMAGRGVDQILPSPCDPVLYEPMMTDARDYVALAERVSGPIPRRVPPAYVWGDALAELERIAPDARIVNLETSITRSDDAAPKGINYRMSPENVEALTAAEIDVCALANNHALDWGVRGLIETLETLDRVGIRAAGAGVTRAEAAAPVVLELSGGRRVLVFAYGAESGGIFPAWAATDDRPGVSLLPDLSEATLGDVARQVGEARRPGDVVVASVHWGGNWGYPVPAAHRRFARGLIERAGIDLVHGHSSHHPLGIEVYRERLILYGCGDLLNDYEGIGDNSAYRPDLALMYFPTFDPDDGRLRRLRMAPMRIRRLQLQRAGEDDARWLARMLAHEGGRLDTSAVLIPGGLLDLLAPGLRLGPGTA